MKFSKKRERLVTVSPLTEDISKLSYSVANLQGIGARARQEDSFTLANALNMEKYNKDGLLIAVCDGMGGMKDGRLASETATMSIRESFQLLDRSSNISKQLTNSLYEASDKVYSMLEGDGGSTAVVCVILNERLYFACAGDSFLYLFRGQKLIKLNAEHNLCHEHYLDCIRAGTLDEVFECRNDPEAQALISYLGMPGELLVDYCARPIPLMSGDIIIACSDGVGGVLGEKAMLSLIYGQSPYQIASDIEEALVTMQRPNQDNYTALIVSCI